jgi:hypothetical protein
MLAVVRKNANRTWITIDGVKTVIVGGVSSTTTGGNIRRKRYGSTHIMARRQTAALRDFDPAYDRSGS